MTTYGSTYGDPTVSTGGAHQTDADSGAESTSPAKEKAAATAGATKDAAAQTAGTAKEQAADVTQQAKQKTGEVAQTAKEQASNVVGEARQQATNVVGEVRTQVNSQAVAQRDRLAEMLRSITDELRTMADAGNTSGIATTAVRQISGTTESLAGYLEQREPADFLDDVRDVARRRPGAFLVGALAAGVVAGRLFKGAKSGSDNSASGSSYGTGGNYGSGDSGTGALPAMGGTEYGTTYGSQAYDSPTPHGDPMYDLPDSGYSTHGQETAGTRSPVTGPLADPSYTGTGTDAWNGGTQ